MINHEEDRLSSVYISEIIETINALIESVIVLYIYQAVDIKKEIAGTHNRTDDLDGLLIQIDEIIKRLNSYKL